MPANDDLRFFGAVCASVSHELKNVLAVMHEQAGLLGDLAMMAERGMPLDPCRLATVADCLVKQVRRGDDILTSVNRFAHTTDPQAKPLDLGEAAELALALCRRRADMHQVCLVAAPGPAVVLTGDPFQIVRLIATCLERAIAAPGAEKTIRLIAADTPDGPAVTVTGLAAEAALAADDPLPVLAVALGANLCRETDGLALRWRRTH